MRIEEITKLLGAKKKDPFIYFNSNNKAVKKGLVSGYNSDDESICVDTLKVIENTFDTDRFCNIFNYLNFHTEKTKKKIENEVLKDVDYFDRNLWYAFKLAEMHAEEFEKDFYFKNYYEEHFCDYNTYCLSTESAVFLNHIFGEETVSKVFEDKINTYNDETIIDRGLLIVYGLEYKGTPYTLLALHGGGDIRGNYYNYFMVVGGIDEVACFYPSAAYIQLKVIGDKKNPLYKSIVEKSENKDGIYFIDENGDSDVSYTGYIDFKDYFINTLEFTEEEYGFLRDNCKMICNY